MPKRIKRSDETQRIEDLVRHCLSRNNAESARVECKRELLISKPAQKAEFIRDVISLSNSEGEWPRLPAHLIIGLKARRLTSTASLAIDGATLGQIIDSYVAPQVSYQHYAISLKRGIRTDVLELRPVEGALYLVRQELREDARAVLVPGQSWGRRADRKVVLSGDALSARIEQIAIRRSDAAAAPLLKEIQSLKLTLAESGPQTNVKRILYEMEPLQRSREWQRLSAAADLLALYARDYGASVGTTVLDHLGSVMNVRFGMPAETVEHMLGLVECCLPFHHYRYKSERPITDEHQLLYRKASEIAWAAAYDAIKYTEDLRATHVACRVLWGIARVAFLNGCSELSSLMSQHFVQLRELSVGAPEYEQIVDYFDRDARMEEPPLPPVLSRI